MKQSQSIQKTYQKKSQIEHILLRPQMYIGPISSVVQSMWVLSDLENQFVNKKIEYCPGLYKIFDEILVNAADNFQRDHRMKRIEVTIDKNKGISVLNDGETIPIAIHKEHKIYVAELIFGHLLTGSNYEDDNKKVTGGRNGYGAKLANIFSDKFQVQTGQAQTEKQLKIKWSNNMSKMQQPKIINVKDIDNYTKITFIPDFKRFNLKQLGYDMIQLMKKRVYDLAGTLKVKVYLNGQLIKIKSFDEYIKYYGQEEQSLITLESSKRWKVYLNCTSTQFQQISFVNSICTYKGGSHVNYIMDQIVQKISEHIKKKFKNYDIKPVQIKSSFILFINCLIQNPVFDSQTKDNLISKPNTYGSEFVLDDKSFKQIVKTGVIQRIIATFKSKQSQKLSKQLKKKKGDRLNIDKLEDANLAGTKQHCTLILTEGDSAKALAVCGLSVVGRDRYGVFPLKGKILNVKDLSIKQIADNQELKNIIQILGLQFNKEYTSSDELRYQTVMIMADQDNDGSHIKGLILNFFSTFWPGLCNQKGFLKQFITPILKCKKGDSTQSFFSQSDFQRWKDSNNGALGWKIKYYKGLGTSTAVEGREYFNNLRKHQITFDFKSECFNSLDMAFNKKLAHLRKQWIAGFNPSLSVDYTQKQLSVTNFINLQLINFSMADNLRSIPSIVDGLKPSQRKILYSCFKRNLRNQIKVAQLSGYVAQNSAYHHGQMSLNMTIIGMAQNYVGSNNLNLLLPIGQFGTRNQAGKDSASARYIYTQLNPLTRLLFPQVDDHIVDYIEQENQLIQPQFYYPILPLVLINGAVGIGMGWSTSISPFKIRDVIKMVRARINGSQYNSKIGWQNFKGSVQQISKDKYLVKGIYEQDDNIITITQIPINKSLNDYKKFLVQKIQTSENREVAEIQDLKQYHTQNDINYVITYIPDKTPNDIQKSLKLTATVQNSNMVLFNPQYQLRKYQSIQQIIDQFYEVRLKGYQKRKKYLLSKVKRDIQITESKLRFIKSVVQGVFKLKGKRQDWIVKLQQFKYKSYDQFPKILSTKVSQSEDENSNADIKGYNYLLNLSIWNFSQDKIEELNDSINLLDKQRKQYESMSFKDMWKEDIKQFEMAWNQSHPNQEESPVSKSKSKKQGVSKKKDSSQSAKECIQVEDSSEEPVVVRRIRKRQKLIEIQTIQIPDDNNQSSNKGSKSRLKKKVNQPSVEMEVEQPKLAVFKPPAPQKNSKNDMIVEEKPVEKVVGAAQPSLISRIFSKYLMTPKDETSKPHASLLDQPKPNDK